MSKTLLTLLFATYATATTGYLIHLVWRRAVIAKVSLALIVAGVLLQTGLLGHRWWVAGYLPVTNLFATLFFKAGVSVENNATSSIVRRIVRRLIVCFCLWFAVFKICLLFLSVFR